MNRNYPDGTKLKCLVKNEYPFVYDKIYTVENKGNAWYDFEGLNREGWFPPFIEEPKNFMVVIDEVKNWRKVLSQ